MDKKVFTRQQLYDEVWQTPMRTLSKKYQISDSGLRKICVKHKIPLPRIGYWQKIQFGKKVKHQPLPPFDGKEQPIELTKRTPEWVSLPTLQKLRQKEIENYFGNALTVPERLTNPDKLITTTKAYYMAIYNRNWDHSDQSLPRLDLNVSHQMLARTLRFMDSIIKLLKKRGHQILTDSRETEVQINNQRIQIAVREKTKIVKADSKSRTRNSEPTGILVFKMDRFRYKEWTDGKVLIEKKLSEIIARLELKAEELNKEQLEREKRHQENERQKAIRLEFEKRRKEDLISFKLALESSVRWHQANNLRAFINEYEVQFTQQGSYSEEIQSYLKRLRQQANWYDPFINANDELLEEVNKLGLEIPKSRYY